MIEISVVLPHPLGPTRKLSSPKRVSKSTPRSASTLASPDPKCFLMLRHDTPTPSFPIPAMTSPSKNRRRFQHEHPADAQDAGHNHDEEDAGSSQRDALPHQDDAARR